MYGKLMQMSGQKCYTLAQNRAAIMNANGNEVTITFLKTGNILVIPREMVEAAIDRLMKQGTLTDAEVHQDITFGEGPITDRLLSVLRMLPGVEHESRPQRKLYYRGEK